MYAYYCVQQKWPCFIHLEILQLLDFRVIICYAQQKRQIEWNRHKITPGATAFAHDPHA